MPRKKIDNHFPKITGKCFGQRLRQLRINKNVSMKTLAEKVGVLETYIPQLERGDKLPSFDTLIYIANALDVTADELLCDYLNAETSTVPTIIHQKMANLTPVQRRHLEDVIDLEIKFMLGE